MKRIKQLITVSVVLVVTLMVIAITTGSNYVKALSGPVLVMPNEAAAVTATALEVVDTQATVDVSLTAAIVEEVSSSVESIPTKSMNVCNTSATFKSYMGYTAITNTASEQYRLQQIATTGDYGIRMINGRYLVAMANQYGSVGDELNITLSSGKVLYVMLGDIKGGTSCTHADGSMIEFIVDSSAMTSRVRSAGNFSVLFAGTIKAIDKVL